SRRQRGRVVSFESLLKKVIKVYDKRGRFPSASCWFGCWSGGCWLSVVGCWPARPGGLPAVAGAVWSVVSGAGLGVGGSGSGGAGAHWLWFCIRLQVAERKRCSSWRALSKERSMRPFVTRNVVEGVGA